MLLLGYVLVTCHKNNIVTLHVTFMLYRRNKTCLLGLNRFWITARIGYAKTIQHQLDYAQFLFRFLYKKNFIFIGAQL